MYPRNRPSAVQGSAMLFILSIMPLLIFLTLCEWEYVYNWSATTKTQLNRMKIRNRARTLLETIEKNANQINCRIPATSIYQLLAIPFSQWHHFACVKKSAHEAYFYVIEFLGNDPCALVSNLQHGEQLTADYLRITLVLQILQPTVQQIIMQSTMIQKNKPSLPCSMRLHFVKVGQQMSREI